MRATRREFLTQLGGVAGAALVRTAEAQERPLKIGHMTFFTGPAAVLGEPMSKGLRLATEEINAPGGLLGRRKIEILKADEAAGTDANVRELRPPAQEIRGDRSVPGGDVERQRTGARTRRRRAQAPDPLHRRIYPSPRYVFRFGNLQSVLGASCAVAVARRWPDVRRIAHIHPDYSLGRNVFDHFSVAMAKLVPRAQVVSESWPKLGSTVFTADVAKTMAATPDLVVTSVWGGDYVILYRQALAAGMFSRTKLATAMAFGVTPHAIGRDHPAGAIAVVPGSYHFSASRSPLNTAFVDRYYAEWREYPNFGAEVAYTAMHAYRTAVERANRLGGGWPDDEAVIKQLEGMTAAGPGGTIYIRPENHQGYRDAIAGVTRNRPEYPFPVIDQVTSVPIQQLTAPPGWPKGEPTSTYTWIAQTWTQRGPREETVARTEPEGKPRPRSEFGQYHALVIGNQAYRALRPLRTPVADARAVADLLRRDYGFGVRLLTDASRTEMIRALDDVQRSLTETDNLLIYYAGHGWLERQSDRGYWLPIDAEQNSRANWLSNADITDTLRAPRAKHVLVVADSCYSGTLTRSIGVQGLANADALTLSRKRARTVMTSGGQEPVSDVGGGTHSVFAKAFLDALADNRGIADVTTLFARMRRQVLLNADQTPEYSDIRQARHEGGDFLFVHR